MTHSFNPELASKIGLNEAIVLRKLFEQIQYETKITTVVNNKRWIIISIKDMTSILPYLSIKRLRSAISNLCKLGYIEKDFLNKHLLDTTSCYSFTELGLQINK